MYFFQPHEEILLDSEQNETSERQMYIVISTPGLNNWAKEKYEQVSCSCKSTTSHHKRNLMEDSSCNNVEHSESIRKRGKVSLMETDIEMDPVKHNTDREGQCPVSKEYILNFPIPMDDGKACIVKVINLISNSF